MDQPTTSLRDEITERLRNKVVEIDTDRSIEETRAFCADRAPWRATFRFSNGVSTEEFPRNDRIPNPRALTKLNWFHAAADLSRFQGAKVLDLGFNEAYHAIFLSKYLGCDVDGIEPLPEAVDRARAIAAFCEAPCNLWCDDANTYVAPNTYDMIIHTGLLYHLHDPWSSVKNTCASLRPGGEVFLETTTYEGADEFDCKFFNWHSKGDHNYWALSKRTIEYMFAEFGCALVKLIHEFDVKPLHGTGMRRSVMWFRSER